VQLLAPGERTEGLRCPACTSERLRDDVAAVVCERCSRCFPSRRDVIDFVGVDLLDPTSREEHVANAVDLASEKAVRRRIAKGERNPILMAQMGHSVRAAQRLLDWRPHGRSLVSLGSGTGFELRLLLLGRRRFERVYSSDLAWSNTALAPQVLRELDGNLGLFAADFEHCPVRRDTGHVGLVFLALHHAEDPHRALSSLLERNFDQLVIVEPITNWLVELLARAGLARRVEYSGIRPQWLDVRRMRRIARANGCAMRIETWWELPRDALPDRVRRSAGAWRAPLALPAAWSRLTAPAHFGSMAAVRFARVATAAQ